LGDNGKLYVPETLVQVYRDEIIPLADIITPNQFEAELLAGRKITCEDDAWKCCEIFHKLGVKIVALSSSEIGAPNELIAFLSSNKSGKIEKFKLVIPKQGNNINLTGTGDLFAALFLAHSYRLPNDLKTALEMTISSVQSVIENTLNSLSDDMRNGKVAVTSQLKELKIIQSKKFIENPQVKLFASKVE
jgi:pyridoxine kinase